LSGDDEDIEDPHADLDVDKAWHGIHYLLTGTAWEGDPPLDFIVKGGSQVGDVDDGALKDFVEGAAEQGEGLLVYIT
jgi:hypothetical protein